MKVIPIASGKGGVGKSLVAANLSVALAQAGKRVHLVDLDLGASNLHLLLGISGIKQGLGTYLCNPATDFKELVIETEYSGLKFIPGDAEIPGSANVKPSQKKALLKQLFSMDTDYLILDLGAGSGSTVLDFFLSSPQGIIVTAPTLTATLNAYLFLKNSVFRLIYSVLSKKSPALAYLEDLRMDGKSMQKIYIPRLLEIIKGGDPEGFNKYQKRKKDFFPQLILNMLDDPADSRKAGKIRRSCKEYLDLDLEHLGIIYRDHLQDIALSSRLPIIIYKPNSVLSQAIYRIADKLMQKPDQEGPMLLPGNFNETFETAEYEAETDFETKITDVEDLLHSGALTRGDLIETITTQQYEIGALKKENQLLKVKLIKAIKSGFEV